MAGQGGSEQPEWASLPHTVTRHCPKVAVLASPRCAHRRAPSPHRRSRGSWMGQRRAPAHGQAARPAGARRVLGLLPRQLAAHAPYLSAWHERYAADGLRVIGIHTGGFPPARDTDAVRAAVARLGIEYPVVIDERLELWDFYGNEGWPARYLWDRAGSLYSMHYGEGAYAETEREIQALLGVERELVPPVRPEDEEGVLLPAQTADQPGAYSGPYEAGAVWAVLEGEGSVLVERPRGRRRGARRLPARRARAPHAGRARRSRSAPA